MAAVRPAGLVLITPDHGALTFVPAAECNNGYRYVKLTPKSDEKMNVWVIKYNDGSPKVVKDFELKGEPDEYAFHVRYVR
jgi:hypothetical protein